MEFSGRSAKGELERALLLLPCLPPGGYRRGGVRGQRLLGHGDGRRLRGLEGKRAGNRNGRCRWSSDRRPSGRRFALIRKMKKRTAQAGKAAEPWEVERLHREFPVKSP